MMQMTLMTMIILTNYIFININHPLAMGLTLLIQTTLISMISGIITKTFWFSYILFLIFMGGLLVLFMYVTSLASNEMFSLSMKMFTISMGLFLCIMVTIYMMTEMNFSYLMNIESEIFNKFIMYKENSFMLTKLYNYPNNLITVLLMNYLLITLIAIVKITKMFMGPLRMMS